MVVEHAGRGRRKRQEGGRDPATASTAARNVAGSRAGYRYSERSMASTFSAQAVPGHQRARQHRGDIGQVLGFKQFSLDLLTS
jgi:hypothetical protein